MPQLFKDSIFCYVHFTRFLFSPMEELEGAPYINKQHRQTNYAG